MCSLFTKFAPHQGASNAFPLNCGAKIQLFSKPAKHSATFFLLSCIFLLFSMKDTSVFVLLRLLQESRIQVTSVNKEEHRSALLCSFIDAGDVVRQKYKNNINIINSYWWSISLSSTRFRSHHYLLNHELLVLRRCSGAGGRAALELVHARWSMSEIKLHAHLITTLRPPLM